ncbi:MAG: chemotaxis protein CheA [Pseudomonadota bacterium]
MNLDQALQTFLVESRELLQEMEDALLRIEQQGAGDEETINAIFRAAHTIKGTAGLFSLDDIVDFTHVVESVLDRIRANEIAFDNELISLFLSSCDHILKLVDQIAAGKESAEAGLRAAGDTTLQRLRRYLGDAPKAAAVPELHQPRIESSGIGLVESDNWHISLRFGPDVLRNGMDPLSFLRYLQRLGEIVSLHTLAEPMPAAEDMDPESCYLGFELNFRSSADKATIAGVFDFVRDDAVIHILPPRSRIAEYIEVIQSLPEDEMQLGQILVRCGSLTETELQQGLKAQAEATSPATPLGEILVADGNVAPDVVEAALAKQQHVKEVKAKQSKVIRVDADKLDHLINLIGEMVIAGAGVSMNAQLSGDESMQEAASTMMRLIEEVRDSALTLRMVQIGETFNRFQRVVRDMSQELGKDIRLEITGAETELDKTVVEKIGDPLMHLVRNSMDHGIESAETRIARSKPAQGTVRLNAYHDSGSIVIEVSDDGGGLDRERILNKAIERGMVQAGHQLSDQEVYKLIFEAGFSTAEQVTNLSGRGVGMDVVRRNIEALRGSIEIDSMACQGTIIRIRLPLTLAIIDGFQVGVADTSFVIPLDMVVECLELSEADRQAMRERNYINLRGKVLPYLYLRDLFGIEGKPVRRENIVVVQFGGTRAGFVVDNLMGEFQTVIKPLGRIFSNLKGIAGSTILGSGEVALILDVPSLVHRAVASEGQAA